MKKLQYVFWCAVLCLIFAIMSMAEPDYKEEYPDGYADFSPWSF